MIDCSHANSQRRHERQQDVARDVAGQIAGGDDRIFGVMIESHLNPGPAGSRPRPAAAVRRLDHGRVHRLGRDGRNAARCWPRRCARVGSSARTRRSHFPCRPRAAVERARGARARMNPVATEIELKLALDRRRNAARCSGTPRCVRCAGAGRERRTFSPPISTLPTAGCERDGRRAARSPDRPALDPDAEGTAAGRRGRRAARAARARMAVARVRMSTSQQLAATPWKKLIAKAARRGRTRPVLHDRVRAAVDRARVPGRGDRGALRRFRRDPGGMRRPRAARTHRRSRDRARSAATRPTCFAWRSRWPPTCRSRY